MTASAYAPGTERPDPPTPTGHGAPTTGHERLALAVTATGVLAASALPGLGLAVTVAVALIGTASVLRRQPRTALWCLGALSLAPWLIIRDNRWLMLSILGTAVLVVALGVIAGATGRPITDLSFGALRRIHRSGRPSWLPTAGAGSARGVGLSVVIGVTISFPIVVLFYELLASADPVFNSWVNPSVLPVVRLAAFVAAVPVSLGLVWLASFGASGPVPARHVRFGVLESTIVLGAVSALFAAFIAARLSTLGQPLDNSALRGEVREGFFQLLWVAALTVVLVLVLRAVSGTTTLHARVRRIGRLCVALAAVIDVLALVRISEYIDQTFHTPLRFWSFGFGVWLLVVLALAAVRLGSFRSNVRWFTAALVTSWAGFVLVLAVVNPDERIARHNFENTATSQVEWIAVNNLISLSEDATPVIVENIEVLRPMPNTRFERMVAHLCAAEPDGYPREFNLGRRSARTATSELCS